MGLMRKLQGFTLRAVCVAWGLPGCALGLQAAGVWPSGALADLAVAVGAEQDTSAPTPGCIQASHSYFSAQALGRTLVRSGFVLLNDQGGDRGLESHAVQFSAGTPWRPGSTCSPVLCLSFLISQLEMRGRGNELKAHDW